MVITLALETSCDETAAAVVADGRQVLSEVVASQVAIHQLYGGVVPEIASRRHLELLTPVIRQTMDQAGITWSALDAVAVTHGPGLVGSLLVGVAAAKALAFALERPLVAVHHLMGHLYAGFLEYPDLQLPLVVLIVSGGHTSILYMRQHAQVQVLGSTRDDAAGEAFDKVARALELGYPGGPALEALARQGESRAVNFPRAWLEPGSRDFSFSGLKTSVINYLHTASQRGEDVDRAAVAAGFQAAVVEILAAKTTEAAVALDVQRVLVVGGVAANQALRREMTDRCRQRGIATFFPRMEYCTDNAAMIGCAAHYLLEQGQIAADDLNVAPYLPLV